MMSELKLVNVYESLRCLFACLTSVLVVSARTTLGVLLSLQSVCTEGVSFRLLVSSRCWFPCPWWYQECAVL